MQDQAQSGTGRRFQAGYVVQLAGLDPADALVCVDCTRCGRTICEVAPATIDREPGTFTKWLLEHERLHNGATNMVQVIR